MDKKTLPPFEELRHMAENDPEALILLKEEMVNDLIRRAPKEKRARLEGLQFQIDLKIKSSKSPLEALGKIYDDMFSSFLELNDNLNDLQKNKFFFKEEVEKEKKEPILKIVDKNNNKK